MAKRERKKRTRAGVPGEAGVAGAGAEKGHNGGPPVLTDEQRQALFHSNYEIWNTLRQAMTSAAGRYRAHCKAAKSECGKDAVKRFERALEMSTPEGEVRLRAELSAIVETAAWVGSEIGTQFSFDLDAKDRTPSVDRAYNDGKRAGFISAKRSDNPHGPGTEQYDKWLSGWHDGQAALGKQGFKVALGATIAKGGEPAPARGEL